MSLISRNLGVEQGGEAGVAAVPCGPVAEEELQVDQIREHVRLRERERERRGGGRESLFE